VDLPSLQDILSGSAVPLEEPPAQAHSDHLETRMAAQRMRSIIAAFCARVHTDTPPVGGRIHVITTGPRPELRAGPYLEPQACDLNAMSLPELEAYLDAVLRVDEGHDLDSVSS
jgi:hypothetical protein